MPTEELQLRRRLAEIERSLLFGEFMQLGNFYAELPSDSCCFLLGARLVLMGAVGGGDTALFTRVLADVRTFSSRCEMPLAKMGAELTVAWLRQHLHVPEGYPAWLVDGNWDQVPQEWRLGTVCLMAKVYFVRRDYARALALSKTAMFLMPESGLSTLELLELKLVASLSLQGLGRVEESTLWLREAVEVAVREQVLLPLLELPIGNKSPLCRLLKTASPALLLIVKTRTIPYFRNLVRFHNLFTGEQLTDVLSPREFYVASSLLHGLRYKEIGERMGVEMSSVNGVTKSIYSKLHIHGFSELADKVW